jgi:putative oxidoreductase
MSDLSRGSSHAHFSHTDGVAATAADAMLLVGRVLIGWLFLGAGWAKVTNIAGFVAYLTNLKVPNPEFWAWIAAPAEVLIGIALILGLATRYVSLFTVVYLIIATALAHRYWEYPAAAQQNQYNHFAKNLAVMGGALFLFVTGGGRFSLDRMLAKKP